MSNWKTTVTAIMTIVVLIANVVSDLINGTAIDWAVIIPALISAIGLIFAKDAVSSSSTTK